MLLSWSPPMGVLAWNHWHLDQSLAHPLKPAHAWPLEQGVVRENPGFSAPSKKLRSSLCPQSSLHRCEHLNIKSAFFFPVCPALTPPNCSLVSLSRLSSFRQYPACPSLLCPLWNLFLFPPWKLSWMLLVMPTLAEGSTELFESL